MRSGKQIFVWLVLVFCVLSIPVGMMTNRAGAMSSADDTESLGVFNKYRDRFVVLELNGLIAGQEADNAFTSPSGTAQWLLRQLKKVGKDDHVKGVLLTIDSPGGTVATSQEIHDTILQLKDKGKLVVVSMGDVAASGGYYVACTADKIVAEPGTLTGSIGVIMHLVDLHGIEAKLGIAPAVIKSGEFKDIGTMDRPMTAAEKNILQSIILDSYDQFVTAVADGRHMQKEAVKKLADGRVYSGRQALKNGLVDELGGTQKAKESLQQMARQKFGINYDLPFEDKRGKGFLASLMQACINPLAGGNALSQLIPHQFFSKEPLWLLE